MAAIKARLGVFFLLGLFPARTHGGATALPQTAPPPPVVALAPQPIIIDAGHGGEDLGAVAAGHQEKDITLAVARRLRDKIEALGMGPVRLTRDSDDFIPLNRRTDETSTWNGAIFISLHANKVSARSLRGVVLYAFGKGHGYSNQRHLRHRRAPPLPPPSRGQIRAGALLAKDLARGLEHSGLPIKAVERADYYVLKNPRTPSVLVELGFLSNCEEANLLADPAYQEKLAESLAAGLEQHLTHHAPGPAPMLVKTR